MHSVKIVAWDTGPPSLQSTETLTLKLKDVNDNDPTFAKELFKVQVREDVLPGDEVVVITAKDDDEGVNARITYSAEPEQPGSYIPFDIEPDTGRVKFKGDAPSLDAEETGSEPFMLKVTATDGGEPPRHSSTLVEVSSFIFICLFLSYVYTTFLEVAFC